MLTRHTTVRIDTNPPPPPESEHPSERKADAAGRLRKIAATVGKKEQPGEHVRCVVSVGRLTEGWDANNVTHRSLVFEPLAVNFCVSKLSDAACGEWMIQFR